MDELWCVETDGEVFNADLFGLSVIHAAKCKDEGTENDWTTLLIGSEAHCKHELLRRIRHSPRIEPPPGGWPPFDKTLLGGWTNPK